MLRNFKQAVKGLPYYALEAGTRSGTTILSRLLDSHPNIVSTGESRITDDTTIDGDAVKTVVSKTAYLTMQPHRRGAANWLNPELLELVPTGRILLTRNLLESIYSTYTLMNRLDPRRELMEMALKTKRKPQSDGRSLLMAINGVIQSRRELVFTSGRHEYCHVDYSELVVDPVAACNKIYTYMGLPEHVTSLTTAKVSAQQGGDKGARESTVVGRMTVIPDGFRDRVNDIINFDIDVLESTLTLTRKTNGST